jgi:DNA-binding XRE family transcriptional regulator
MSKKRQGLIDLRLKKNLNQGDAAKKIGISRSYLSELESGDKDPSLKTIKKFIDFYGDKVKDIFFNNNVA